MENRTTYNPLFPDPKHQPSDHVKWLVAKVNKLESLQNEAREYLKHIEKLTPEEADLMRKVIQMSDIAIPECKQTINNSR